MTDIRCPGCQRLLGRLDSHGVAEIKMGDRYVVRMSRGTVHCPRCQVTCTLIEKDRFVFHLGVDKPGSPSYTPHRRAPDGSQVPGPESD